jgi:ATP-dependent RNA helicase
MEKTEVKNEVKVDKTIAMEDEDMIIESSEKIELVKSFDDLGLNENLLRGLYAYGFNKPSAVQKRAILPILKKRDVIVQS